MRYIRKTIITSTIDNSEITDPTVYKPLLEKLKEASVDISIEYRDEITEHIKAYDRIRILTVAETGIDIHVFMKNASTVIKNIKYENILTVKLITSKNNIKIESGNDLSDKHNFLDI